MRTLAHLVNEYGVPGDDRRRQRAPTPSGPLSRGFPEAEEGDELTKARLDVILVIATVTVDLFSAQPVVSAVG